MRLIQPCDGSGSIWETHATDQYGLMAAAAVIKSPWTTKRGVVDTPLKTLLLPLRIRPTISMFGLCLCHTHSCFTNNWQWVSLDFESTKSHSAQSDCSLTAWISYWTSGHSLGILVPRLEGVRALQGERISFVHLYEHQLTCRSRGVTMFRNHITRASLTPSPANKSPSRLCVFCGPI
jgi:hypothetical protein